ncbi:glycosyltransferase 87 family protein [Nonomuraea sp. SYSU D8015]|uniref:glycosyltransferase 87 family protein n=1 Tax=Nonomuraea sp. SYSU D8015 TaxID=2593644 RepID=UPI0016616697|nr:glycosyltransferase 87 family protein [Nonomuraea sp. SYSU D8015]
MNQPILTALLLAAGLALAIAAQRYRWRLSLRTTLLVAVSLRVAVLIIAAAGDWQPVDFVQSFRPAGEAILRYEDPVLSTDGSWRFLPMIPYAYAATLAAGIPWEVGGRLVTVVADVGLVILVGKLAGGRHEALRRFQYACCPLAVMVASIHGQVEPVSLVFLVGAYLAARSDRGLAAGVLFGLALSAKSWPIVLLPVVLMMLTTWRGRLIALLASGALPLLFLVTLPLGAGTPVSRLPDVVAMLRWVRPIVGEWGWTAWLTGGNWALEPAYATVGQVFIYSVLIAAFWLWRRGDPVDLTSAMLLAFMVVTPRLGAQYLLWFVPFLIARPTRWSQTALTACAVWAGLGYIYLTQFNYADWAHHHSWWAMSSVLVIPFLVLAMPWDRRKPPGRNMPRRAASKEVAAANV